MNQKMFVKTVLIVFIATFVIVTVQVASAQTSFTITTTSPLPNGQVGTAYSTPIDVNSGAGAWGINNGSLPPGLSFSTNPGYTNYITGTPTTPGNYTFSVYANAGDYYTSKQFSLTVADEGDYIETSQKSQPPEKPIVPPVKENVVPTIKSSSEISAMLVEQKQLKAVDDIELSSDEQQYTARGYRDAKFLFFIPVSVKVELKINVVNGNIEQVKKSWWAFLVRY